MKRNAHLLAIPAVLIIGLCAGMLEAGPLSPPVGPVAPTPGPEPRIAINATNTPGDADSLYRITTGGSYYLTGNVTGVAGKHGIEIAQWGVTVDLNGFEMNGGAEGTLDAIAITAGGPPNITVRNGSVRNWGGNGINISVANSTRVEGIVAANNTGDGIIAGDYATVSHCSAYNNDGKGIIIGFGSTMTNCTAVSSGSNGISIGTGCVLTACVSIYSGANGVTTGTDCVVTHCSISKSDTDGLRVTAGTSVSFCTVSDNGLDGIECSDGCLIQNNNCRGNGTATTVGAGIHATGSGNRIEGNQCADADRGIDVDAANNWIIRNTCRNNTTGWTIVADNIYAPIIDRRVPTTVPTTAAVNGPAASSTLGSTDPNANFTY